MFVSILAILIVTTTLAWQPSGWIYHTGAYAYSIGEGEWYYFNAADTQWRVDLASGVWDKVIDAVGWNYYTWPYAYSSGAWYWFNTGDKQWCVELGSGSWSVFGLRFAPSVMVQIPAGSFSMGDNLADAFADELPVHTVNVSEFHMDNHEVTNDKMLAVLQWAYDHNKLTVTPTSLHNAGGNSKELLDLDDPDCRITWNGINFGMKEPKGSGYPCVEVTWYGAIAFCNYRSQMDGLTPCYNLSNWSCNWSAGGYRLPTEAEWEKAARGGQSGQRFPWGNTINHSYANYVANGSYEYDTSTYLGGGRHPDYDETRPYTSPAGAFGKNGYGLYDMSGNVHEWCWDCFGYYSSSPATDPHGPTGVSDRIVRGGSCESGPFSCRVAHRNSGHPDESVDFRGFRCVR